MTQVRPLFLVLAVALLACAALVFVASRPSAAPGQPAERPNLLLIQTDDMETDDLKAMPTVSRLAAQGTTFANSFVGYSLCCPSRSTLLTGQYNHNNGVLGNGSPTGGYAKLDHSNTLPVWLRAAGYQTTHIGKYLNGYGTQVPPQTVPPGYSDWQGLVDPGTYRMYDYQVNDNGTLVAYGTDPADYQTDVLADRAVASIRAQAPLDQPFYLNFSPLAPHGSGAVNGHDGNGPQPAPRHVGRYAGEPLDTDPSYNEADVSDKPAPVRRLPLIGAAARAGIDTRNRRRLESLLAVDEAIARMIDALQDAGELDDTLIVFTSDNGWQEGEHRVQQGKVRVYEPSIRVPLIVRGPGFAPGVTASAFAINTDIAPTLAVAAGVRPGRLLDGMPLTEVAAGTSRAADRPLLNETGVPGISAGNFHQAIRTAGHLYVEYASGERELYDLRADPYQLTNRASEPGAAGTIALLASKLASLKSCAGETCRALVGASPQPPPVSPTPVAPPASEPIGESAERALILLRRDVRLRRDHRIRVPLRCSSGAEEGCRGILRLYAKRVERKRGQSALLRIGRARRFALEAGDSRRVAIKLGRRARRRLARERRPTVIARVRYQSLAGGVRSGQRRYKLLARR